MEWIDRKIQEIPKNTDVIVIWKGRLGILNWDDVEGPYYTSCPAQTEIGGILVDDEFMLKIDYWMKPNIIFRSDS